MLNQQQQEEFLILRFYGLLQCNYVHTVLGAL